MEAAEAAAAAARPSSPRSKKRSNRRGADRSRSRSRSPIPNPISSYAPSRKSVRKRKPRAIADLDGGGGGRRSVGAVQKLWNNADEIALLVGTAAFRARTGAFPRLPDMGALYESIKGCISTHLDQAKVYYKLKRLKSKFLHTTLSPNSGSHERRMRSLSADLWGAELAPAVQEAADEEEAEEMDAEDGYNGGELGVEVRLPVVSEVLGEYWRRNGRGLSSVSLEKGLAQLDAEEGRAVEAKWRQQLEAETRTQMRRHDLAKEVCALLIDAVRRIGP